MSEILPGGMDIRSLSSLTGMPVLVNDKRIGRVTGAKLSDDYRRLDGVLVDTGLTGTRFVSSESISLVGSVAIHADQKGERGVKKKTELPIRAVTTGGERIGAIVGAEIDELSFAVTGLTLSMGYWDDIISGRRVITRFKYDADAGEIVVDIDDGRYEHEDDEGAFGGDSDRLFGGDAVRDTELADRAQVEQAGDEGGSLDGG